MFLVRAVGYVRLSGQKNMLGRASNIFISFCVDQQTPTTARARETKITSHFTNNSLGFSEAMKHCGKNLNDQSTAGFSADKNATPTPPLIYFKSFI